MKTSVVVAGPSFQGTTAPLTGTYENVAAAAAAIGFDAIQLTVNRPLEVPVREVLQAVDKHGLAVSSIATGLGYTVDGLSLGNRDEANRLAAVQRMREHVDLAAQLGGARVIIGAIRGWARDSGAWNVFERQFRQSVAAILHHAEKRDIDIILEANDHLETDAYLSVKETAEGIASYGSPRFKLHLDSMHLLYERQDVEKELPRVAPMIAQVDISDEDRMAPDGKHFDFPLLMRVLKEINYQDYLVFEYRPSPPENAAKAGYDYIQTILQQLAVPQ